MSVPHCPAVAGHLIVEMRLLLALAGVLVTLVLAQPCEATAPGNDKEKGSRGGPGGLWFHWTLSPLPSEQPPPEQWRPRSCGAA